MEGPGRQPLRPVDDENFVGHFPGSSPTLRASFNSLSSREESFSIGKSLRLLRIAAGEDAFGK